MKKLLLLCVAGILISCASNQNTCALLDHALSVAGKQLLSMDSVADTTSGVLRSWDGEGYKIMPHTDWTCGFYPGTLWLYYQLTGQEKFCALAKKYTARLSDIPALTDTHDLGFMVFCSYGKQQECLRDSVSAAAILKAAESLASRFNEKIGLIRSWDFGPWNYPVIIDNMMNLEMLFWASEQSGVSKYRQIAIQHADKTMQNHFREDASSYHVVSYNDDGTVESKGTFQGYSDDSRWARGQAWGLYGYTMCFRHTGFERYLAHARRIAELILAQESIPEDGIPYWDYDSPDIPDTARDASAAAVTASALLELCEYVSDEDATRYERYAKNILCSLSAEPYLAMPGSNGYFILKHSTGAASLGSEIDVPLNYADYYYLEAVGRFARRNNINFKK